MPMRFRSLLPAFALVGLTSACVQSGAGFVPVVDGPVSAAFSSDLAACQNLAAQQGTFASNTTSQVAAGAGLAAGGTALTNNRGTNVRDAAIIGAAAGAVSGALDQQKRKEAIIRNCMRQRGHNVVG